MSWVYAFDVTTGKLLNKWLADPSGHTRYSYSIFSLAVSRDGRLVAAGMGGYRDICIWDVVANKRLAFFKGGDGCVYNLVFSPDASYIASTGSMTNKIAVRKVPAPESK
jgi:WD40 repeat protein